MALYSGVGQGWAQTQKWVRGGLKLRSGSGVGSDSELGQGWAQTQKWVRDGLKLRSGSGVGSDSEVGQGWAQTQKWVRGGLRLRSGSGVGSDSELVCIKSILKHCIVLCEFLHTHRVIPTLHPTSYKCVSVTLHVICTVTAA